MSAVCTHRGATLKLVNQQPRCPIHGSRFDDDGKPVKGPASTPLAHYGVRIDAGRLIVDKSQQFTARGGNEEQSSVTLPG
jgi:cytochrome b6-f complex iron-sulfur subunit